MSAADSTHASSSSQRGNRFKDITGQVFSRLTVIEFAGMSPGKKFYAKWLCRCKCGNTSVVAGCQLRSGSTKSCGCLGRESVTTHGMSKTPLFNVWWSMIQRCEDKSHVYFADYGGRGIAVCERWRKSFEAFVADMGSRPTPKHQIDRYPNNNGNYEPSNCRWATCTQNQRNKRSNHLIEFQGKSLCIIEWAELLGISEKTICQRLARGWSEEDALSIPTLRSAPGERHKYKVSSSGGQ